MKSCSKCRVDKDSVEFHKSSRSSDGLCSYCKSCSKEYHKAYNKTYNRRVPKPEEQRRNQLKFLYNITPEDYDEMLKSQGGHCAACDAVPTGRNFHIDHDHSCCPGKRSCGSCVRGILCYRCNSTLGLVNDNPQTLQNLVTYINKFCIITTNEVI